MRVFATLDAVARGLAGLGLPAFRVDATGLAEGLQEAQPAVEQQAQPPCGGQRALASRRPAWAFSDGLLQAGGWIDPCGQQLGDPALFAGGQGRL